MKNFNSFTEAITLEFSCDCGEVVAETIDSLPQANLLANNACDSENSNDYIIICPNCDKEYTCRVYVNINEGNVEIVDEDDNCVEEFVCIEGCTKEEDYYEEEYDNELETIPQELKRRAEELFEHNRANTQVVNIFGDWAVNSDGDIININDTCAKYPIFSNRQNLKSDEELIEHLNSKTWFDINQKTNLLEALEYIKNKVK